MTSEWHFTSLGEAFATVTGSTPPKNNAKFYGTDVPLVKPPELRDSQLDCAEDGLSAAGASVARVAPPNSVLVSCIGNLGKIGLNTVPVAFNQQINAILPDEEKAMPEFMFYQALSPCFKEQLAELSSGTTVSIVNKSKFNSIKIVLAPIQQQKRIVAILDEAFDSIATAKANAEKNLQNAKKLFQSCLHSSFLNSAEQVQLSTLASDISDGDHAPPPKTASGVPFITISNIDKATRQVNFDDTFTVSAEYFSKLKANRKPRRGDVLYTVTGSFGIPVLVDHDAEFCFQRHIGLVRPDSNTDSRWLSYALLSPQVFEQANERATGTAQKTVSLSVLRSILVPKVPLNEQRVVASKLGELEAETQRLESLYQQKLAALDELKKSLLHEAFSGNL